MEYGTVIVSWGKMPATTISRVYAGHHQITLAILDNNGGNNCLHSKGGLHFGIRKRYLPLEDGTGVACVPIGNEEEVPVQTQLSAGLKFKPQDVSEWEVDNFYRRMTWRYFQIGWRLEVYHITCSRLGEIMD